MRCTPLAVTPRIGEAPAVAHRTGDLIAGRYRLDRLLEAADAQRLHLADDLVLSRRVALRMPDGDGPDPVGDDRIRREGRMLARAAGPGVVQVLDAIETDGRPLVVTDHVEGNTLDEVTRQSAPLPAGEAVGQAVALIDALLVVRGRLPEGRMPVHRSVVIHPGGVTITGLRERPAAPDGRDPGVHAVCETLYELLTSRSPEAVAAADDIPFGHVPAAQSRGIPAHVREALARGLGGEIASLTGLRAALTEEGSSTVRMPLSPEAAIVGGAIVVLFVLLMLLLSQCDGGGGPEEGGGTVSGGAAAVTVPDLLDLTEDEAVTRVRDADLDPRVSTRRDDVVDAGRVADQTPDAGERTPAGSRVVVIVSSGRPQVRIPDVRGLSLDQARRDLRDRGLLIRGLRFRPAPERAGTVLGTLPRPGAGVDPGTEVTLVVSG